jgi:hypothetical protein
MLKFFLSILRAGIIAAALATVALWVLGSSPSFESCIQEKQTQGANSHLPDYFAALPVCLGSFVHKYRDELVAVFTIVLALSTIYLWFATGDLVRGAERTAKRQLRAYVGVDEVSITGVERDKKPMIYVRIKNYGQTPAYSVKYWADIVIAKKLPVESAFEDRKWSGESVLDPSSTFGIYSETTDVLPADDADAIGSDTQRIYFMARLVYRDAFGKKRTTDIRQECGGGRLMSIGRMSVSKKGNRQT